MRIKERLRVIVMMVIVIASILYNKGNTFAGEMTSGGGGTSINVEEDKIVYTKKMDHWREISPVSEVYLTIEHNTILVVDNNLYFLGIRIEPGYTLKIQLKSGDLHVYGQFEKLEDTKGYNVRHAGIEVPHGATLIVEQISESAGELIAVGAGSNANNKGGYGTGAGIGGNGYELKGDNIYSSNITSDGRYFADCGTVIIRSGTVYACGGCGIGNKDTKINGTGAGIGGGGIFKTRKDGSGDLSINLRSSSGGTVKIYGGNVFALGGGGVCKGINLNLDYDNIYNILKNELVTTVVDTDGNEARYFGPITGNDFDNSSVYYVRGTGAGIGGGGLYFEKGPQPKIQMNCNFNFYHYAGTVYACRGVGYGVGSDTGCGAYIGGGGGYSEGDSDCKYVNEEDMFIKTAQSVSVSREIDSYYTTSKLTNFKKSEEDNLHAITFLGSNWEQIIDAGTGDFKYTNNITLGKKVELSKELHKFIHEYTETELQEGLSDYNTPNITLKYAVGSNVDSTIAGRIATTKEDDDVYKTSLSDAISSVNLGYPYTKNVNGQTKLMDAKVFIKATVQDPGSNFKWSAGASGLKEINIGNYISLIKSDIVTSNEDESRKTFFNDRYSIKPSKLEGYGCRNADMNMLRTVDIYFYINNDIIFSAIDFVGHKSSENINVSNYFYNDYETEQTVLSGLPSICTIQGCTSGMGGLSYDYVYFGSTPSNVSYYDKGSPIKWRVLNTMGNDESESLFILSEYSLIDEKLRDERVELLQEFLRDWVYKECFTPEERATMCVTSKRETNTRTWTENNNSTTTMETDLFKQKLFLFSVEEVLDNKYGFMSQPTSASTYRMAKQMGSTQDSDYWLRTGCRYKGEEKIAKVYQGKIYAGNKNGNYDIRPVLNIPLSHIICAFDANDAGGTKEISAISTTKPGAYRLTIYDEARKDFKVKENGIKLESEKLTIEYENAGLGGASYINEYIAVGIKEQGTNNQYWGRYNCTKSSDKLEIALPFTITDDKKSYDVIVYNETNKGPKKTNYAGFSKHELSLSGSGTQVTLGYAAEQNATTWEESDASLATNIDAIYVKASVPVAGATIAIDPATIDGMTQVNTGGTEETYVIYKFTKNVDTFTVSATKEGVTIEPATGKISLFSGGAPSEDIQVTLGYAKQQDATSWETSDITLGKNIDAVYVKASVPVAGATIAIAPATIDGMSQAGTGGTEETYVIYKFTKNVETFTVSATKEGVTIKPATGKVSVCSANDEADALDDDSNITLIKPTHLSSPVTGITITITVTPGPSSFTIDDIIDVVTSITSLDLKDSTNGFAKVNWDLNKPVNWDAGNTINDGITRKLIYKDVGTTLSHKDKAVFFDNTPNMDIVATINSKAKGRGYTVATYGANEGSVSGKKEYTVSGSSGTINSNAKDYMYLVEVSGTKDVALKKTEGGTTITDVAYEANSNITIGSCTRSGNNVTVQLSPTNLITGQHIKEVGVRAEYTQNGVTASRVKRTNDIDGKNGSYTFTFANLPSSPTVTAYYINTDNEEISTVA